MSRSLPPLNALRAFETTARHLSFTKAAVELNVTPAALSHQIRGLEETLRLRLFHRRARSIELTGAGAALYPRLKAGFDSLREALDQLDQVRPDNILVVSSSPGFTAKWLVPRLYRFLEVNPEIEARVAATLGFADFKTDGVDVAIRLSSGVHPGLHVEKLLEETAFPLCSPRLVKGSAGLKKPEDLARFNLIHFELPLAMTHPAPTWADWMAQAHVTGIDVSRGLRLNVADHALDAAVEGAGVVLGYKVMAAADLLAGRLVSPFGPELSLGGRAYHLVCPRGHEKRPKIRAFRDWLMSEVRRYADDT